MSKLRTLSKTKTAFLLALGIGVVFFLIVALSQHIRLPLATAMSLLLAAFVFIALAPQERVAQLAYSSYTLAPMYIGIVGTLYFWWYANSSIGTVPSAFFEVTAQIIPVLILTTIVDVRRARRIGTEKVVGTLLALVTGQIIALFGIVRQDHFLFALVCGALTSGFVALVLSVAAEGVGESSTGDSASDDNV